MKCIGCSVSVVIKPIRRIGSVGYGLRGVRGDERGEKL